MSDTPRWTLPAFLDRLAELHLAYVLARYRDSINVEVYTPGEHWEVEFMDDGTVEVERFKSSGKIGDERWLDQLLRSAE
jgi:hypothetical protein